jgi:hypothetical protein
LSFSFAYFGDVADQSIASDFAVVIEGLTEQSQLELIEQLTEQGYKCKTFNPCSTNKS